MACQIAYKNMKYAFRYTMPYSQSFYVKNGTARKNWIVGRPMNKTVYTVLESLR